ncbi:MAG: sterol desaturase family protein [Planctomycetota bacterium]
MNAAPDRRLGSGWLSGLGSVVLGALGLGVVLCFHFPEWLTLPELRALYPLVWVRAVLHGVLIAGFVLGVLSVWLRRRKVLGLAGLGLTVLAVLLGGSRVPIDGELTPGPVLSLDWFLLNLLVTSAIFLPLERLFALRPEQEVLRPGWRTDLTYVFISSIAVQLLTVLTLRPAMVWFQWTASADVQRWIAGLPVVVQFLGLLLVADLTQYAVHRAFHQVPLLWRFHRIHHSPQAMDWLAGSRLHLVDVLVTRGLTFVPIHLLGFAEGPLFAYIAFVSAQATFIHANVRFSFGPLRWLLATPQFHHWHHAAEPQAANKNFAVHLPVIDRLFGSHYLPKNRWPRAYGLLGEAAPPEGWFRQLLAPFARAN